MEQNIRLMLGNKEYNHMLSGKIEVDEVYMVRDTSIPTKQGHGTNKQKVFGMRQRNSDKNEAGELRIQVVPKVTQKVLHPIIIDNVKLQAWLMSDEWGGYNNLTKKYKRGVVNHGKRQYVDGDFHTNSIEGAWAHLRKLIAGIYHRPSKEHLQRYLNEFEFRYNNRKKALELIFKSAMKQSDVRTRHKDIKLDSWKNSQKPKSK